MGEVVYVVNPKTNEVGECDQPIEDIRPVILYFLSYGRNAWHTTWIARYKPDQFFRDMHSVDKHINSRTWQGTVLYLDVLPAIQFTFSNSKFVLTEINANRPFENFHKKFTVPVRSFLDKPRFLNEVAKPGLLWTDRQNFYNGAIAQEVEEDYLEFHSAKLICGSTYDYHAKGRPLKLGYYKRKVSPDGWRWLEHKQKYEGVPLNISSFNSSVKGLVSSIEERPRWV